MKKRSSNNAFDRYKKPRKQIPIGSGSKVERKSLTPEQYRKWLGSKKLRAKPQPRKTPLTLSEKANELSKLAIQSEDALKHGPDFFVTYLKYRGTLKKQLEKYYENPLERRQAFISTAVEENEIRRTMSEINSWVRKMKRPELELTFDEMIRLILE